MALAVSVRFEFVDGKGKTSFTKVRVPNGFSISQYTEFAQSVGQMLTDMSQAKITGASFVVAMDLSGATIKASANALSDIAQKAFFSFTSAIAGFSKKLKIPGLNEDKVIAGSDALDQSDPQVAAFITAMENGLATPGGTMQPTDARDNDLVNVGFARELFRRT